MHALNATSAAALAACRGPAAPARYAVVADPMHLELRAEDLQPVPEGATFADLVDGRGPHWLCAVVGEGCEAGSYLPRAHWHTLPRHGDVIVFHRRALGGGGGNGGSNTARVLLTLAVLVVANVYGPAVGSALGFTGTTATAVGSAVITVAGQLAINAIVPMDGSNAAINNTAAASPTYSASVQGNAARLGQPVPVRYGHNHGYPDFACTPYQTFVDGEQYYHAILCEGMGHYDVLRVSIEDTPVQHFSDVETLVIGPGQADGETLDDQTLVSTNIVSSSEVSSHEMVMLQIVGPFTAVPRDRQAVTLRTHMALPRGLDSGRTITWRFQARQINEFEQPIGAWVTLGDESYSTASATPVRLTFDYTVAAARWQVQGYRTDIRDASPTAAHDLSWIGLDCELDEPGIDTSIPATYVVLRMRGSQQLNGVSQRRVRVMSNRKLPVWNGSSWSAPQVTRSIAWAAADILRNTDYGRGLADSQIDLGALLALDAVWAARFDKFDMAFDTLSDTWAALALVLRTGRAVPLIRGSRYTFVRDGADTEPVAMYGMRNIRRGSFALRLAVPERDAITALDIEYWDQTRWDWVTLTVQYVGAGEPEPFIAYVDVPPSPYTRAENRARLRVPGIIGRAHCARWGAYHLADMLFRRSEASYRTHLDGLLPAYGAPVLVSHDVPSWGQSGDVVDWDGGSLTVTTSEPLQWGSGQHYMKLQAGNGVVVWEVSAGAEPNEAIVADDLGFVPSFDSANRERTRYIFGPAADVGALCRVRAITPRGERDVEHRVVLEDARVHSADEPWLPVGGVDPDPAISDGDAGATEDSEVLVVRVIDRTVEAQYADGGGGPTTMSARFSLLDDGTAEAATISSTGSGGGVLPNEWLQGGAVPNATAALYEARVTLLESASTTSAALSGTLATWQGLGTPRHWELTADGPGDAGTSYRRLLVEIRIAATSEVQDTAIVTLRTVSNAGGS